MECGGLSPPPPPPHPNTAPPPPPLHNNLRHDLRRRPELLRPIAAPAPFDDAVREALRADGDAQREADEVRVLELHARAFVAVVEQHVDAGGEQLRVDLLGRRAHAVFLAERGHDDGKRRDRDRPDDAVVVVALLHRGGDRAADAEAVAAHDHRLALAVLVEERAAHRLRVLRAELEHVPDLDAAVDLQRRLAARAGIAGDDGRDVGVLRLRKIAAGIDAAEVKVFLVAADDPVDAALQRRVGDHARRLRPDRAAVADRAARRFFEARVGHHLHPLHAGDVLDLDLVPFAVAAHEDHEAAFVGVEDERLDELRGRLAEEAADVVDRLRARRVQFGDCFARRGLRLVVEELRRRLLHVCAVAAARARHDGVLARLRQDHELVRGAAADVAGVGLDRHVVERAAAEDGAVGVAHFLVRLVERRRGGVERVRVLHGELAPAHEAEARPHFVAEFGLDLIEVDGELPVRVERVAHGVGDDLLGRRPVDEVALVAVFDPQQLLAVALPAPRLHPQLAGVNGRPEELDGAGAVHLLADDGLELLHGAEAERQIGVNSGGNFADHPGAHHQSLADDVGVGRDFAQGVDEGLAPAHGRGIVLRTKN
jgi:hypothetical protein